MERQFPPGLSDAQRYALLEFYAGHLSAGQLTARLGIDAPGRPEEGSKPKRQPSRVPIVTRGRPAVGDTGA